MTSRFTNRRRQGLALAAGLAALSLPALATAFTPAQSGDPELDRYLKATPDDTITRLQTEIDAGRVTLKYDGEWGYLPAVLKALNISPVTQNLVFSKTSFQRDRISRRNPRALYFNDDVYVGYVPGGDVVEISTADPRLGAVFYTLDQTPTAHPKITRRTFDCIQCHQGAMTSNVPGHIMRSVYPMRDGQPDLTSGTYLTTDASPMEERWGGWYVTGKHGVMRHMGNAVLTGESGSADIDRNRGANITDLSPYIDTDTYLSPGSDIVALLVLQHQVNVHNLITKAREQTRRALEDETAIHGAEKVAADDLSDSARGRIRSVGEPLVRALLFADEPRWNSPVKGTSGFAGAFGSRGPQDARGRSLRQFDLTTRLFRYPCSYLIYSDAFDAMPRQAREYVYRRILEVVAGTENGKGFDRLTAAQRQAIGEILRDTKPEFAAFAKASAAPPDKNRQK